MNHQKAFTMNRHRCSRCSEIRRKRRELREKAADTLAKVNGQYAKLSSVLKKSTSASGSGLVRGHVVILGIADLVLGAWVMQGLREVLGS